MGDERAVNERRRPLRAVDEVPVWTDWEDALSDIAQPHRFGPRSEFDAKMSRRRDSLPKDTPERVSCFSLAVACVAALALGGCDTSGREERRATRDARLVPIDLVLTDTTFGYLKRSLALLKLETATCETEHSINDPKRTIYVDCRRARWGESGLIEARFVTGERGHVLGGVLGAHSIDDRAKPINVVVYDRFVGTLCGVKFTEVMATGLACGHKGIVQSHRFQMVYKSDGTVRDID